jgi:hypothetical protein
MKAVSEMCYHKEIEEGLTMHWSRDWSLGRWRRVEWGGVRDTPEGWAETHCV